MSELVQALCHRARETRRTHYHPGSDQEQAWHRVVPPQFREPPALPPRKEEA